ncbi:MAG TPA: thioesterase family protein [Nocardioidaceae bacterium]|nr:thioesterase family protein [Nocardioidaceae bacterium]
MHSSFYVRNADGGLDSTPHTASAWGPEVQHGGPPSALLAGAVQALPEADGRVIGRITVELLGPIPVAPLTVSAQVVRPGRSVALAEAVLSAERPVARASVWLFPDAPSGLSAEQTVPAPGPAEADPRPFPPSWQSGYADATEWRWASGYVGIGRATAWIRPRVELVSGEPWSPIARLMTIVDSASGVSSALDPAEWGFLNTELTVHVLRPPVGEWICLDAKTTLSSGSVGLATSHVYDEQGLVARSAQALLMAKR